MSEDNEACDYLVVGAGSAGCVVASRLSEDPDARVLLLEAGGDDAHPDVRDPTRWPQLFYGERDWGYSTTPQRHAGGRKVHCPRGRMLGGCHSHNASAWVRGHPRDFDAWAYRGNPGWGWASVSELYRRIEDWQGPPAEHRGTGGPLHVAPPEVTGPIADAFVAAGEEIGLPVLSDINNGPDMEGVGYFDFTIRGGERFSVVSAYLRPAMERPNLTVMTGAEALRLHFEGRRCTGAAYARDGRVARVGVDREVVVCAGAIGSPRLLLLSGVGPAEELRSLGIEVVADLPGVGRNLQDHPLLGVCYEVDGELPPLVNNGAEATLWWKSDPGLLLPDVQPVVIEFPFTSPELAEAVPENAYALAPSVVRPASRGSVRLASPDPAADPLIDMAYLQRDADLEAMLFGVELCREMGAAGAFDGLRKREIMPGDRPRSELIAWVRQAVTTYFHPTSSCRMGTDETAVVDPRLRVHGVEGLRVADASIMPAITTGNTNAPSVAIGEKAADLIRA